MLTPSHPKIYDAIGNGYQSNRIPDPRIELAIKSALGKCQSVCNIGAGTGSYEPTDIEVVAVEPSTKMIQQRINSNDVVQASAEKLPFGEKEFDVTMAVLTIHHWRDIRRGLLEMARVSQRQVIFTFDPELIGEFWLMRDYFPHLVEPERQRSVPLTMIEQHLNVRAIRVVPIPWDCTDGFLTAYWRRPENYLKPAIRNSISTFSQATAESTSDGIRQLREDLESGFWYRKYSNLLEKESMDFGYRIIEATGFRSTIQ